jgi:hypothetical protein
VVLIYGNNLDALRVMVGKPEEKLEDIGVYGRVILIGFSGSVVLVMNGLTF